MERSGLVHGDRVAGCDFPSSLGSRFRHTFELASTVVAMGTSEHRFRKNTSCGAPLTRIGHSRTIGLAVAVYYHKTCLSLAGTVAIPPGRCPVHQSRRMVCYWIAVLLGTFPNLSADFYSRQFLHCLGLCATERGARFFPPPSDRTGA